LSKGYKTMYIMIQSLDNYGCI